MQVVVHFKAIIHHVAWQSEHGELGDMEFDSDFIEHFAFPSWPFCYWLYLLAYLDKMDVIQKHYLYISLFKKKTTKHQVQIVWSPSDFPSSLSLSVY